MAEPSVHNTPYSKASRRGFPIVFLLVTYSTMWRESGVDGLGCGMIRSGGVCVCDGDDGWQTKLSIELLRQ